MENNQIEEQIEIAEIISKSLYRNLSVQEKTILKDWLNSSPENVVLYDRFKSGLQLSDKTNEYQNIDISKAKKKILVRKKKVSYAKYYRYAAVFIGLLVLGSIGINYIQELEEPFESDLKNVQKLIIEDKDIILQLANGKREKINVGANQKIVNEHGQLLGIQQNEQLVYKNNTTPESLTYNTISVPYGKRFQLVLSDGTKVHLNAGSSLKYPVKFIPGKERKVFMQGEVFFDVAKVSGHSFVVNTADIDIEVLGTKFNVSSYPEDNTINTVLVEGSVNVMAAGEVSKNATVLVPKQKASWDKLQKNISVEQVDPYTYIGWMDGKFVFNDTPFKTIIEKLERNYNVKFENRYKELENRRFTSSFDIEDIDKILQIFSKYMEFDYSITDNKIIINQLKN